MDASDDENGSAENTSTENPSGCSREFKVGKKVYSEDEAYNLYNEYALSKGFSVRKGNKRRDLNGTLRQREYLCSKAGYRKTQGMGEVKEFNHLETRTDCKARIRFTIDDGIWTISHLNDVHNHELATSQERRNLRSGRKVVKAYGDVITSMVAAGIKPTQSYNYLSREVGADHVGFTKVDCFNYLHMEREKVIDAGDGQSVINFFKRKQVEDPMFFYSIQVDEENRMANFFWRDGRSKLDYECFGDVIIFDTTYRTNKYNLICAPFVGINHHWKNKLFGCAFLSNETTESFIWLFETFLEAMGNQQPKSIFTDQDQAMANAIEVVFTGARHRLCMWHISNNAKQHLAGLFANESFKALFHKCFYGCYDSIKFESDWAYMVETFGLEDHSWLKRLYDLREKWCPAFNVDFFSARTKSTQRSESTNSVFHQIMRKPMSLLQVIQYYEEKVEEMRRDESSDDFRCKNGAPPKVNRRGILNHASKVYTLAMFNVFEEELLDSFGLNCVEASFDGRIFVYHVTVDGHQRVHIVQFDPSSDEISCSCKLFEILGILCQHALRVLVMNNYKQIPESYILKRWTRSAKLGIEGDVGGSLHQQEKSTRLLRLSELNHIGQNVFDKGSLSRRCTEIVKDKLREAMKMVEEEIANSTSVDDLNCVEEDITACVEETPSPTHDRHVLDPVCVRTKGSTNARIKSYWEKKKRKTRRGSEKCQTQHPARMAMAGQKRKSRIGGSQLEVPISANNHNNLYPSSIYDQFTIPTEVSCSNMELNSSHFSYMRLLVEGDAIPQLSQEPLVMGVEMLPPHN